MTKAPLEDARKSRAKGPARRKRAASPSATATEDKAPTFSISTPMTLWLIDEGDAVQVSSLTVTPADPEVDLPKLEKAFTENVEQNTAEPTLAEPMSPEKAEARASQTSDAIAADIAKMQKSASMTSEQIKEAVEPGPRTSIAEAESEQDRLSGCGGEGVGLRRRRMMSIQNRRRWRRLRCQRRRMKLTKTYRFSGIHSFLEHMAILFSNCM